MHILMTLLAIFVATLAIPVIYIMTLLLDKQNEDTTSKPIPKFTKTLSIIVVGSILAGTCVLSFVAIIHMEKRTPHEIQDADRELIIKQFEHEISGQTITQISQTETNYTTQKDRAYIVITTYYEQEERNIFVIRDDRIIDISPLDGNL